MGADRQQLLKSPVRYRLSRLPHYGVRRHLRGAGEQYYSSGQLTQRDFLPCGLYGDPLLFPVQIRRTCKINFRGALKACQGQGGDFQSEAEKIRPDLDAGKPHRIGTGKGQRLTFALITLYGNLQEADTERRDETPLKRNTA